MEIVKMQFGSHVYGTNVEGSDLDFKAVHLPEAREILLGKVRESINLNTKTDREEKNTADDIDIESFSLGRYMKLLCEGQTVALDMLFTPERWLISKSSLWEEIQANKSLWVHKGVSAFVGYCRQQANKYGIKGSRVAAAREAIKFFEALVDEYGGSKKLSEVWDLIEGWTKLGLEHVSLVKENRGGLMLEVCNRKVQQGASIKIALNVFRRVFDEYGARALMAETNEGVDWKACMHAVRVCEEAKELLRTGEITFPRPEADLLLKIRRAEFDYKDVAGLIEKGMLELEMASFASNLRSEPDKVAAEDLVCKYYEGVIRGSY